MLLLERRQQWDQAAVICYLLAAHWPGLIDQLAYYRRVADAVAHTDETPEILEILLVSLGRIFVRSKDVDEKERLFQLQVSSTLQLVLTS